MIVFVVVAVVAVRFISLVSSCFMTFIFITLSLAILVPYDALTPAVTFVFLPGKNSNEIVNLGSTGLARATLMK